MILITAKQAVLSFFEVRQAMGIIPIFHAFYRRPLLIIHGIATNIDHPVNAAGAAKYFSPAMKNSAIIHVWLWFRLVTPIVKFVAKRGCQSGRHVDENVPNVVGAARFDNKDFVRRICAKTIG